LIKGTLGITALFLLLDQIIIKVCDLDVELEFPSIAEDTKGWIVHP